MGLQFLKVPVFRLRLKGVLCNDLCPDCQLLILTPYKSKASTLSRNQLVLLLREAEGSSAGLFCTLDEENYRLLWVLSVTDDLLAIHHHGNIVKCYKSLRSETKRLFRLKQALWRDSVW